ncbi:MAG TPA: MFS transporter, partial [Anaerolineae bacterium]|nr:MFS transporter [Anaerolineae bacterium]
MIGAVNFIALVGTIGFVKELPVRIILPPIKWPDFLRSLFDPLRDHDFRWVFMTRFLMIMGTFTVQEFLQYFMRDVVKDFSLFGSRVAENAESAVSFFVITLLIGAVISSLAAGILSDKFGRKKMVYAASILQAFVPFVFIFFNSFLLAVGLGVVFGLGYGAYASVDWAMASDVLPSEADHAKDMGVWHVADTLPQVIATPIAGLLLDRFQQVGQSIHQPTLGYTVIFSLAVVYFVLGTVLVRKIRKVR